VHATTRWPGGRAPSPRCGGVRPGRRSRAAATCRGAAAVQRAAATVAGARRRRKIGGAETTVGDGNPEPPAGFNG
jgi:hypothetical protein